VRASSALFAAACLATAAFGACGGSKSSGPSGFACPEADQFITVGAACRSCVATNCNAQAVAEYGASWQSGDISGGACASMVGCLEPCDCDAGTCISSCLASTPAACTTAAQNLDDCVEVMGCLSACTTVTGYFSSPDGGGADANLDAGAGGG
jgi:hypothetical protein